MQSSYRYALAGLIMLALAIGIGRFALTPLLPLMQADAGLSLVAGGWLASISLCGYLVGALALALRPLPVLTIVRFGLVATVITTVGMGLTTSITAWLLLRFGSGIASAGLMIGGISWTMSRLRAAGRANLEGVLFSGTGVGVVASGLIVAALKPLGISAEQFWIGLGVLCVPLALLAWQETRIPGVPASAQPRETEREHASGSAWSLITLYGLNGFAYIIPASFLPLIVGEQLHAPGLREWFWPLFGAAAAISVLIVPMLPPRLGNRGPIAACAAIMAAGMLLCVGWPSLFGLVVGTLMIGAVAMPIVMLIMREARLLAPRDATRLIAALTATFGIGQALGPIVGAWLAEQSGGFTLPMVVAAGAAVVVACLAVMPRYPTVHLFGRRRSRSA